MNLLTYIYYRALKFYQLSYKAATPLQFLLGVNFSTLMLLLFKFLVFIGVFRPFEHNDLAFLLILSFFAFSVILMVVIVLIFLWVNKLYINQKIAEFSIESVNERKKNSKKIMLYVMLSLTAFACSVYLNFLR